MSDIVLATDEAKTTLENSVAWFLADKISSSPTIATKKYMTNDNLLVYLTNCGLPEPNVPRVKVQVFARVDGGVHETGYQLYSDRRFEKYDNDMIFGANAKNSADGTTNTEVTQEEADKLLQLLASLQTSARQTL